MERPYQYVPLVGLIVLHAYYQSEVDKGNYKFKEELDKVTEELNLRLRLPEIDKQITIDEYIRSRKHGQER